MSAPMYQAVGDQVFVDQKDGLNDLEPFLTIHQTRDNPMSLEKQAQVIAHILNKALAS
jgi:hypothetical protein